LLMFNEFNKSPIYPIIYFEDLINLIEVYDSSQQYNLNSINILPLNYCIKIKVFQLQNNSL
jgi:hypothetical protein